MPQVNANFAPNVWSRPRPPTLGEMISAVLGLGGGDGVHLFKRQPEPGAGAWALVPTMPMMPFAVQGPGYIVRNNGASTVLSGPQVQWHDTQIVDSVAGTIYGGAYQQGLIDWQAYFDGHGITPPGAGRG